MERTFSYAIGLMSGTSLDGVDLVYVRFEKQRPTNFKILLSETISYDAVWKERLQTAIGLSKEELINLDVIYGDLLAQMLCDFIKKHQLTKIDFIASHGHTVLHEPHKGITLQIGSGQVIANKTQCKVVCDFRTQDVQLGGQGAPLVPIGDALLFSDYDACINLGGFANISYQAKDRRIAFDICPVNIVLNRYANLLGLAYDDQGKIAAKGLFDESLFTALNRMSYYSKIAPKSLGLEWVQQSIFPLIDASGIEVSSVLRTFTTHSAFQIAKNLKTDSTVLITGGGVLNSFLIAELQRYNSVKIAAVDATLIHFKEALIFAFLGLLRLDNQVNCLSSVTGAKRDHSSGVIFKPLILT
ncbi:anhydro-N-acetylmuramic acid kinase [Polaribacter pacificus]|uniref:Anhydro-N-acetylmuramic acid kinase n=1 Tax=Polaribacter pacificus TaxID=1775173 RepID=A0A917MEW9_9FLAO|nr:anhydro-N-acetylmuramic acid kinase [Polaribacter pacificus]GGH01830.1 anhydro-N-acetylmuramic acid kinase [Polaribacter pacificus]